MLFLFISVLASSTMSIVIRFGQDRTKTTYSTLAVNYLTCIICSLCFLGEGGIIPSLPKTNIALALGAFNGSVYLISLALQQYSIKKNGVVFPSVFSKIGGLMIPIFVSILFFGEKPALLQIIGSVFAAAAIIIMSRREDKQAVQSLSSLFLLFFIEGIASVMSKIFEETGSSALATHFILYTFSTAFILCTALVLYKKERPGIWELVCGVAIGIPNYFATRLLLRALRSVPAVIAYPVRSAGCILVVALAGLCLFHERLSKKQWCAIAMVILAVVLLSI